MIKNNFRMNMRANSKVKIVQRLDCKAIQPMISTRKKVNNRANIVDKHDFKITTP